MSRMSPKDNQDNCDNFLTQYIMCSPKYMNSYVFRDLPNKIPSHTKVGQAELFYNDSQSRSHHETYLNQVKMELGSRYRSNVSRKSKTKNDNERQLRGKQNYEFLKYLLHSGGREFLKYLLHSGGSEQEVGTQETIECEQQSLNQAATELVQELTNKRSDSEKQPTPLPDDGMLGKPREYTICPGGSLNKPPTKENKTWPSARLSTTRSLVFDCDACTFNMDEVSITSNGQRSQETDSNVCRQPTLPTCSNIVTSRTPRQSTVSSDILAINLQEYPSPIKPDDDAKEEYGRDKHANNNRYPGDDKETRMAPITEPACSKLYTLSEEFKSFQSSNSTSAPHTVCLNNNKHVHHINECPFMEDLTTCIGPVPANFTKVSDLSACPEHNCNLIESYKSVAENMPQHDLKYNLLETAAQQTTTQDYTQNSVDRCKRGDPIDDTRQITQNDFGNDQKFSFKHGSTGKGQRTFEEADRHWSEFENKNHHKVVPDSVVGAEEIVVDRNEVMVHRELDVKTKHTKQGLSDHQQSQANLTKWTSAPKWSPEECTLDSKNRHNPEIFLGREQCSFMSTERINKREKAIMNREERIQLGNMLNRGHQFIPMDTHDSVEKIRTQQIPGQTRHERKHLEDSTTETQDSKSDYFLPQQKMLRVGNREASFPLRDFQSFTDGSLLSEEDLSIDRWSKQEVPFKMSWRAANQPPHNQYNNKYKLRQISVCGTDSPRKYSPKIQVINNGKYTRRRDKGHKMYGEREMMNTVSKNYHSCDDFFLSENKCLGHKIHPGRSKGDNRMSHVPGTPPDFIRIKIAADEMEYYSRIKSAAKHNFCNMKHYKVPNAVHQRQPLPRNEYAGFGNETDCRYQRSLRSNAGTVLSDVYRNGEAEERCPKRYPSDKTRNSTKDHYADQKPITKIDHLGARSSTHCENLSNTSESLDSICEDSGFCPTRRWNGGNSYATDEEFYDTVPRRCRRSPTISRGASPHKKTVTYELKSPGEIKQYKTSKSSMRRSLKQAIISAKESIYAATRVAEALSLIDRASPDSSASVLSEQEVRCPVQNSTFPRPKLNPGDNIILEQHTQWKTPSHPSHRHVAKYLQMQDALCNNSLQRSSDQRPRKVQKKKRLPQSESRLKGVTHIPEAFLTSRNRKAAKFTHSWKDVRTDQTQSRPDTAFPATIQAISPNSLLLTEMSPQVQERTPDGTDSMTAANLIVESMPGQDVVTFSPKKADGSPKFSVQIIFSKSPENSQEHDLSYLVQNPSRKKDKMTAREKYLRTYQPVLDRRKVNIPKQEQSSEMTLSKEEWTFTNSCCSSTYKTNNCFNKATTFTDPMSQKMILSPQLDSQCMDAVSDSLKFARHGNSPPAGELPSSTVFKCIERGIEPTKQARRKIRREKSLPFF